MYINGDELKDVLLEIYQVLDIPTYKNSTNELYEQLKDFEGNDDVVLFFEKTDHRSIILFQARQEEKDALYSDLKILLQDIITHQEKKKEKGPEENNLSRQNIDDYEQE